MYYSCWTVLVYSFPFRVTEFSQTFQSLIKLTPDYSDPCSGLTLTMAAFSDSWAEHVEHLAPVLPILQEAGLTLNAKKCHIGLLG